MKITSLSLVQWRNLEPLRVETDSPVVVLWGRNGAGKTNFLEAVGVLATLKSFRGVPWRQLPTWGRGAAQVEGVARSTRGTARLAVRVGSGGREVRADRVRVDDLAQYFRHLRAVVFTPDDTAVVKGGPEHRRRFLDRASFNAWPGHLQRVRDFRRALAQKSALLREGEGRVDPLELAAWNDRLVPLGVEVVRGRLRVVRALAEPLNRYHAELSGGSAVRISYRCAFRGEDVAAMRERYRELLEQVAPEEQRRGINLVGPQRDDLEILYEPNFSGDSGAGDDSGDPASSRLQSARRWGSQGQVRSLALALKLAELAVARDQGETPLMLLDDLSSELDARRSARLVQLLRHLDAQVWVTTTDPRPVLGALDGSGMAFEVNNGALARQRPSG